MGHGSGSSRKKVKTNIGRYEQVSGEFAEPLEDVYANMPAAYQEALRLAMRTPSMRAGHETMMRNFRDTSGGMSEGSRAAMMMRHNQQFTDQLRGMDLSRSQQLGNLAGFARGSGMKAAGLRLSPIQQWIQFHKQRAAEKKASEDAKKAGEAGMWSNIGELGVDVGMAFATGGATAPGSFAKWAGKGNEMMGGRSAASGDLSRMDEWQPESEGRNRLRNWTPITNIQNRWDEWGRGR